MSPKSWWQDQFHRVTLSIDAPGPTLNLHLCTAINQGGNDVKYIFILNSNGAAVDAGPIVLEDALPPETSPFTGDLNGGGIRDAATDPVNVEFSLQIKRISYDLEKVSRWLS